MNDFSHGLFPRALVVLTMAAIFASGALVTPAEPMKDGQPLWMHEPQFRRLRIDGGFDFRFQAALFAPDNPPQVTAETEPTGTQLFEDITRLTLIGGQSLAGDFLGLDQGLVTWRSPWFDQPITLDQRAVATMQFAGQSPPPNADDRLMVTFLNGDRLQARLVSMDDRHVTVETAHGGTLRLLRGQVRSLRWPPAGDLLRSAHPDAPHWKASSRQTEEAAADMKVDGDEILIEPRQDIELQLDLPKQIGLEFTLNGHDGLGFELRLDVGGERLRIVSLGSELLLLRGSDFVRMGKFDTDSPLTLRCFWDRDEEHGMVADSEGNVLGRWQMDEERAGEVGEHQSAPIFYVAPRQREDPDPIGGDGAAGVFTLNSRGKPMTLSSFKVFEWSGQEPAARSPELLAGPRITLSADRAFALPQTEALTIADGMVRMNPGGNSPATAAKEFALAEVEEIWLSGPEQGGSDPGPDAQPGEALLKIADGSELRGRIRSIDARGLIMDSVFVEDAVKLDLEALVSLEFLHSPDEAWSKEHLTGPDRLIIDSHEFKGTWKPHPDARPRWLLPGAIDPVPLRDAVAYSIDRSPQDESPASAGTLLFLNDGQILPGELLSILGKAGDVVFQSVILNQVTIPGDRIRGLGFSRQSVPDGGFRPADWQVSRGRLNQEVLMGKDAGEAGAKLNVGGGIARTVVLPDKGFSFSMNLPAQAGLRVVLASEDEAPDATKIAIVNSNNLFHCGLEAGPQRNSCRGHFQATAERVDVDVSWDDTNITLAINGQDVASFPHQGAETFGRYVGFENEAYGRTNGSAILLHQFGSSPSGGPLDFPVLDPQAKEQILNLPRFLKDDPPRQVVLAKNGDMLRGVLEGSARDLLVLRAGLETFNLPRDRMAAVVWLTPPSSNGDRDPEADSSEPEGEVNVTGETHTILLHSGAALIVNVESFGPDFIRGQVDSLGPGTIPVADVASIRSGRTSLLTAGDPLSNWQMVAAPDPLPIAGGQDGRIGEMIGQQAGNFVLPLLSRDPDGEAGTFDLADHRGRVVILDFWASWCAPCVRAMPEMIDAFAALDPEKVTFLAVNQAEAPQHVRQFLNAQGWDNVNVAMDGDQSVARSFKVGGIPHCVIIGPDGKIAWASTGFRAGGSRALVEVIESLLDDSAGPD